MAERNVYFEPEDRVLLRTADVYQTEAEDDISSYSDTLLEIVADFKNSGTPDGFNAQSMAGKSKRGEVACRLFARIDPDTGIIEAAGFKARGCLAMTACASAACLLIEGKGIEEALQVSIEDIRKYVDGVPAGKVNALHFAACAVQGLVGDFLMCDGAALTEIQEAVPCDEGSISCIMAEHCSFRESLLEARMEQEAKMRAADEENALAQVFDLTRKNTGASKLTKASDWAHLIPPSLTHAEFEERIKERISKDNAYGNAPSSENAKSQRSKAVSSHSKTSEFANRGVGVPKIFTRKEADDVPKQSMPETRHALVYTESAQEEDDFDLVPPEGYKLVEVDGVLCLTETDEPPAQKQLHADARGIRMLDGTDETYLYDGKAMTQEFAKWAYLADKNDPLATFVYCVREDSRVYPRPLAESDLANHPFNMSAEAVQCAWQQVQTSEQYCDIGQTRASNGDVYYYSTEYLSPDHADSLAEWASVERFRNV